VVAPVDLRETNNMIDRRLRSLKARIQRAIDSQERPSTGRLLSMESGASDGVACGILVGLTQGLQGTPIVGLEADHESPYQDEDVHLALTANHAESPLFGLKVVAWNNSGQTAVKRGRTQLGHGADLLGL